MSYVSRMKYYSALKRGNCDTCYNMAETCPQGSLYYEISQSQIGKKVLYIIQKCVMNHQIQRLRKNGGC